QDGDDVAEQVGELGEGGERDVEDRDLLLQLHRQLENRSEHDGGGVAALQRLAELAERADEAAVVQPRVEVLEHDQRRFLEAAQRLQRGVGLLGLGGEGDPARLVEAVEPAHGGPTDERLAVSARDAPQKLLDPSLLGGHEPDQRVAGPDERVQLADEPRPARRSDGTLCGLRHGDVPQHIRRASGGNLAGAGRRDETVTTSRYLGDLPPMPSWKTSRTWSEPSRTRRLVAVLALLVGLEVRAAGSTWAIEHARLIPSPTGAVVEDATILVRDGKVKALGPSA